MNYKPIDGNTINKKKPKLKACCSYIHNAGH